MSTKRIASTMYIIAIFGFIGLMAWLFSDQLDQQRNPNQDLESRVALGDSPEVVLQRNRAGHYVATGEINGLAVEFMLDTGATDVAVSSDVAERAGLQRGRAIRAITANGETTAYQTVIDSVRLGSIVEHQVRASIVPNMNDIEVLLGMSFLKYLDFAQRGDQMIIQSRHNTPTGGQR